MNQNIKPVNEGWRKSIQSTNSLCNKISRELDEGNSGYERERKEYELEQAMKLRNEMVENYRKAEGYRELYERNPGIRSNENCCSPMFVAARRKHYSQYVIDLAVLTPDRDWVTVTVPMADCNDHGAKLRARLLSAGATVAVDIKLRKLLLHYVLNSPARMQDGEGEQS